MGIIYVGFMAFLFKNQSKLRISLFYCNLSFNSVLAIIFLGVVSMLFFQFYNLVIDVTNNLKVVDIVLQIIRLMTTR